MKAILFFLLSGGAGCVAAGLDTNKIEQLSGLKGVWTPADYWGRGKAAELARAVKAALDTQAK